MHTHIHINSLFMDRCSSSYMHKIYLVLFSQILICTFYLRIFLKERYEYILPPRLHIIKLEYCPILENHFFCIYFKDVADPIHIYSILTTPCNNWSISDQYGRIRCCLILLIFHWKVALSLNLNSGKIHSRIDIPCEIFTNIFW